MTVETTGRFFRVDPGGDVLLEIKVVPRASADRVAGIEDRHLKIRITAPPVEGKANDHLLKFLAEHLKVRRSQLCLLQGEGSRLKRIRVAGLTPDARAALLANLSALVSAQPSAGK
jgi:uncharacterized protein